VRRGFGAATTTARTFARATSSRSEPARQQRPPRRRFDLTPTDEQQMLTGLFGQLAAEVLRPAGRKADDACEASPDVLGQLTEAGLGQLGIPTELGGFMDEGATVTGVLAASALAHGDPGITVAALAPAAVANLLALYGDADQQDRWLTPFAGERPPVAALAVAEPRPLFDPFDLRTTARRTGGGFVLDGRKAMVARVGQAELFLVAAALDGSPALFVVEAGDAGLTWEATPSMGVRAAAMGELRLRGVHVDGDALLADADAEAYREVVARGRIAWAAIAIGAAQATLDLLVPYVKQREAFGEPIAHRQAVAFTISDIAIELDAMRLATWRAASLADQGKPFRKQAALARQLVATHGMQIGSDGIQLLGGHGFVKEYPCERWYRDLRGAGQLEGVLAL
jgi:alkylation response protein AidB-like acyl-CoA dehydrogenase